MEINKIDFFSTEGTKKLSTNYDFNKDGKVDIQDYNYAMLELNDDDPNNDIDINMTKDDLNIAFADLLAEVETKKSSDAKDKEIQDALENNKVFQIAETFINKAKNNLVNPENAKSFTELQEIGKNLSKHIKDCAKMADAINTEITTLQKELEEIEQEKIKKEEEYAQVADNVDDKTELLSGKMIDVMSRSEIVSNEMQKNTSNIIAKCVEKYKNGEYEGQDLYTVITSQLGSDCGAGISLNSLQSTIDECDNLGVEIKSLCSDIENIVGDIRSITQKFNNKTTVVNNFKDMRNATLESSNKASALYEKGYSRRNELRQEIIDKYKSDNPMQAISKFVDNNELKDLSFSDAYVILQGITSGTGISFKNGNITMPNFGYKDSESEISDENRAKMATFNKLSNAINARYASQNNTKVGAQKEDDIDDGFDDLDDFDNDDLNIDEELGENDDNLIEDTELEDISDLFDDKTEENAETTGTDGGENEEEFPDTENPCALGRCTRSTAYHDPITFKNGNSTFHFISDNDKDGVFDGASEFLGANNGWSEMEAYDSNGDGKINGSELEKLKLVSINDNNGQYTFMNANEAGIKEIDLSTYQDLEEKQTDGDVLQGSFKIQMKDGKIIDGEQTDDTMKNITNRYSNIFGVEIADHSSDYQDNVFMEEFVEILNTNDVIDKTDNNINSTKTSSNSEVAFSKDKSNNSIQNSSEDALLEKKIIDKQTETKEVQNNNKQNDEETNIFKKTV